MKKIFIYILSLFLLIISSCQEPNEEEESVGLIIIESPIDGEEFIRSEDFDQELKIIATITNKDVASSAYIYVNDNVIASGLSDTLTASYEPNVTGAAIITATLLNDEKQIISSDEITISMNVTSNTLSSETIFMNIDGEEVGDPFKMMRHPVTNRQFIDFLNNNEELKVNIVDINWDNTDGDQYGNPDECDENSNNYDDDDNYTPAEWWYVTVTSHYAPENESPGEYIVYRNGHNPYDPNAVHSQEGGKIRYDCKSGLFQLPGGDESEYIDHPVVGVSWVGANVYANYFGWTLPTMEQWELAARGNDISWVYPWSNNNDVIDYKYANYDSHLNNTSPVQYYNGVDSLNLSLSAYGLYDMAGNVWEHTLTESLNSGGNNYIKTGGAFDSDSIKLQIGYNQAISGLQDISYKTGFRCVATIDYVSSSPSGCTNEQSCNYDSFAESSSGFCFEDDCLNLCGGITPEIICFEDLDQDGFGNPNNSELQCNEPQTGWVENADDKNDDCFSPTDQQDNVDCVNICEGEAYIDGCEVCVGGTTGIEECEFDCNGVENGDAFWDDCEVCSGGDTGHEANSDLDCNNDCFGTAFEDDCGDCVGGNTGLEENSSDQGCGCGEDAPINYCTEAIDDIHSCCDCNPTISFGGTANDWGDCSIDDTSLLCETEVTNDYTEIIFGCANENADNYYCNQENNQCIDGFPTTPPCNLINDGCIIYGCSDDGNQDWSPYPGLPAANYEDTYNESIFLGGYFGATVCADGSLNNCCEYSDPVTITIEALTSNSMDIYIDTPYDVGGIQVEFEGGNITGASGGAAADAGFTFSTSASLVLGFSFDGSVIPAGTNSLLMTVDGNGFDSNTCIQSGVISNEVGQSLPVYFSSSFCD